MGDRARRYVGWVKRLLKNLSGRTILISMFVILKAERLPALIRNLIQRIVYFLDDLAWLIRDFPRVKAYRLLGDGLSVIIVGSDERYRDLEYLFFQKKEFHPIQLPKVALWRLPRQTSSWLQTDADLVVCVLSRLCPWKPKGQFTFSSPDTIVQVVDLPEQMDSLLKGGRIADKRRLIRQAERQDLKFHASRSHADLELFHHEMYLPTIHKSYGDDAQTCSISDHRQFLDAGGELLLVYQGEQLVAGAIIACLNEIAHGLSVGILHGDKKLIRRGAFNVLEWCSFCFAKERSAAQFDLGGSVALCSNRVFDSKSRWRAHVERHVLNSRPIHVFAADSLPEPLRERLNNARLITELGQRHYSVYIPSANDESYSAQLAKAAKYGLDGVAAIENYSVRLIETVNAA